MSRTLEGKTALVIGGSRGIGAAIVRRLAADGARVAFTYVDAAAAADALADSIGVGADRPLALQADSGDADAVRGAVDAAARALGGIDILVNNTGINMVAPLQDMALDDFDRLFAINVRGFFVAAQEAVRHMPAGGRIVAIGSILANRTAFAGEGAYGATKAAVASLVRGLALDLVSRQITVNVVHPGPVATEMSSPDDPMYEYVRSTIPLGRFGLPEEVASLVAYVVGPETAFMTGSSLSVDGGVSA